MLQSTLKLFSVRRALVTTGVLVVVILFRYSAVSRLPASWFHSETPERHGTTVVYRTGTLYDLLSGLDAAQRYLGVTYGDSSYALRKALIELSEGIYANHRFDLATEYDELTAEQQVLYDGVALLLVDFRAMIEEAVIQRPANSASPSISL